MSSSGITQITRITHRSYTCPGKLESSQNVSNIPNIPNFSSNKASFCKELSIMGEKFKRNLKIAEDEINGDSEMIVGSLPTCFKFKPSLSKFFLGTLRRKSVDLESKLNKLQRTYSNYGDFGLDACITLITNGKLPEVVVFDFDKTITIKHTGGTQILPTDPTERAKQCMKNIKNPHFWISLCDHLVLNGVKLWICSYANENPVKKQGVYSGKDLIVEYLIAIYGSMNNSPIGIDKIIAFQPGLLSEDFFNACEEVGINCASYSLDEEEKNIHLMIVAKREGIDDYGRICLIDDSDKNIRCARSKGFSTVHVDTLFVF